MRVCAAILAAGLGERLRPITLQVPKPYLPLPRGLLIEDILDGLSRAGVERIYVVLHYMAYKVLRYLRLGGVEYVVADRLLGTAGQLWYLKGLDLGDVLLVVNGDVVADIDFADLARHHISTSSKMTIAARVVEHRLRFGVLKVRDGVLEEWVEKPTLRFTVAAGIYALDPSIVNLLDGRHMDMNELARYLVERGFKVSIYEIPGAKYLDVGVPGDYAQSLRLDPT